jgi:hypothetical protein
MGKNRQKEKAFELRKNGFSYNMITSELSVAKSTLSAWFKNEPFSPNKEVLKRIQYGPMKSAEKRHNKKVLEIETLKQKGKEEIGNLSKRDLWFLGLGLYIGEGSKTYETVRIINSDPTVIKLALKWFREVCNLDEENITIAIHLYPDNNKQKCLKFWSKTTDLPLKNFRKTQIDTRENKSNLKKRKLPYGTAHITIVSKGVAEKGVKLHRKISGWMYGALSQM